MKRSQLVTAMGVAAATVGGATALRRFGRKPSPRDVVRSHYAAIQTRDWVRLKTLTSNNVEYRDPDVEVRGREEMLSRAQQLESAFSDVSLQANIVGGNGHEAVAEWKYTGNHSAPMRLPDGTVIPPAGRRISVKGMSLFQVQDGVVTAEHTYWDNEALHSQLQAIGEKAAVEA